MKHIDVGAFYDCLNIQEVHISDFKAWCEITNHHMNESPFPGSTYESSLYLNGKKISGVVAFPEGITRIPIHALWGCNDITSVVIPKDVTEISNNAFRHTKIESITIPSSVQSIGWGAFYCDTLKTVYIEDLSAWLNVNAADTGIFKNADAVYFNGQLISDLIIPDGVTLIPGNAFRDIKSLKSVTIPNSVVEIGENAFCSCRNLEQVIFGDNSSLTTIGEAAFEWCGIKEVTIPKSVKTIGARAFYAQNIDRVYIADIDAWCNISFGDASASPLQGSSYLYLNGKLVTDITLPCDENGVSNLAFKGCSSLISATFAEGTKSIGDFALDGCTNLVNVYIPDGITSVGAYAFRHCESLSSITITDSVTSIMGSAFEGCSKLYQVINNSDLVLTIGGTDNGEIAYYAKVVIDKDGNKTYKTEGSDFTYVDTADGFRFIYESGMYQLIAYLGSEDTVTLPTDINGSSYEIYKMRGVKNVIIPDSFTFINEKAFTGCSILTSISIPDGVISIDDYAFHYCSSLSSVNFGENSKLTTIGSDAFSYCSNLTSIDIPDSVTEIGDSAFWRCSSLTSVTFGDNSKLTTIVSYAFRDCSSLSSINIPDSVTEIGYFAFEGTAYYNNPDNWVDGTLYIGNALVKVSEDVKRFTVREGTTAIARDAFDECYLLKHLTIGGEHRWLLSSLTNLETLVLTELPTNPIYYYFGYNSSDVPITLKRVILGSDVRMSRSAFKYISGITIYVEDNENDVKWDDNYPGWSNGNTVIYGDEWIRAKFYDESGSLYADEIFTTAQVIRIPYLEIPGDEQYSYTVEGYDTDGDGVVDTVPATSTTDVEARAIVKREIRSYTVTFVDKDGETPLYSYLLPYGAKIELPEDPVKQGYKFLGWQGYEDGMTVTGDLVILSEWQHEGEGHVWAEPVWVDPTCTEGGYNKHICTLCGEWYADDVGEPLGHSHELTVVAPTCTEEGYNRHLCFCGDEYRDGYVDALGHSFTEWVVDEEAKCESAGLRHHDCYVCGESIGETVPALGHSYTSYLAKEPTCTEEGEIVYTCSCGDRVVEVIGMTEHNYEQKYASKSFLQMLIELILDIFFGYEGDRGYYFQCSDCGHIATADEAVSTYSASASVKATCDHQLGEWATVYEATCVDSAVEGRSCSLCGEVVEARIAGDPLGHSYTEQVIAPTHTEGGYTSHICSACGDTYYSDLTPATGHNHTAVVTAPTCEKDGYTTYTCSCGDSYVDSYTKALGHTAGEWITDKSATCESIGYKHTECTVCGTILETAEIVAKGHSYSEKVTAPTCEKDGYTTYTCTCGDVYVDDIVPATGHSYSASVTAPTCEKDGYTTYTCTCGDVYVDNIVPATGHSHTSVVTAPTCTAEGYTTHTCACGDSYVDNYTDALGHTESTWITDKSATCESIGYKHTECTVCGTILETAEIAAKGHSYSEKVTAPTCTAEGYTTHTCACGDSYVDNYTDALGHTESTWITDKAATCESIGYKHTECTVCGTILETAEIAATGHSYTAVVTAPTCEKDGYTTYTCSCGDVYVDDIVSATGHSYTASVTAPTCTAEGYTTHTCACGDSYVDNYTDALGHTPSEWITDKAATCESIGYKHTECTVCGTILETAEIAATGHSYSASVTAPTCTAEGYTTHTCACGDSYVDSYTKALGHTPSEWITDKAATCESIGYKHTECTVCGTILETAEIAAKGHSYSEKVTAPTCTAEGYTTHTCACGDSYVDSYTKALGHTPSEWITDKAATLESIGYKHTECTVCGTILETAEIAATGHSYTAVVTAPTCEKDGYTTYTCTCGDVYVDNIVPATGHSHTSVVTAPTCEKDGYTTYTCSCGDVYVDNILPATGHSYTEKVTAPTCEKDGYTTYTCTCGDVYVDNIVSATGHSHTAVVTAPTCTAEGYTTHTCACGDSYVDSYAKALGHTFGEWTVTREATEDEKGERTRSCACGHSEAEELPRLEKQGLSGGAVAGIVAGSVPVFGLSGFAIAWFIIRKKIRA